MRFLKLDMFQFYLRLLDQLTSDRVSLELYHIVGLLWRGTKVQVLANIKVCCMIFLFLLKVHHSQLLVSQLRGTNP